MSYNHKLSKLVDLSLSCNKVPILHFVDVNQFIENDAKNMFYELLPVVRIRNVIYSPVSESKKFDKGVQALNEYKNESYTSERSEKATLIGDLINSSPFYAC